MHGPNAKAAKGSAALWERRPRSRRPTGRRAANPHRAHGTTPDHQRAVVSRGLNAQLPAVRR
jgi:hypothetical protein